MRGHHMVIYNFWTSQSLLWSIKYHLLLWLSSVSKHAEIEASLTQGWEKTASKLMYKLILQTPTTLKMLQIPKLLPKHKEDTLNILTAATEIHHYFIFQNFRLSGLTLSIMDCHGMYFHSFPPPLFECSSHLDKLVCAAMQVCLVFASGICYLKMISDRNEINAFLPWFPRPSGLSLPDTLFVSGTCYLKTICIRNEINITYVVSHPGRHHTKKLFQLKHCSLGFKSTM